jgi:hypothetical protein
VSRHAHARRQQREAIVLAELDDLGIQFRIVPVGLFDDRRGIVEDHDLRHASQSPEGVLQGANERLGGQPPHGLAVALARVAEHGAKHMRAERLAVGALATRAGAVVDLQLVARLDLDAAERQLSLRAESLHVASHRTVPAREAMLLAQVLVNALGRESLFELLQDLFLVARAKAARARGRGRFRARFRTLRAGGRFGNL